MKKYYVTITAKRKNAKRHFYGPGKRLLTAGEALKAYDDIKAANIYIPAIYTSNWKPVHISTLINEIAQSMSMDQLIGGLY